MEYTIEDVQNHGGLGIIDGKVYDFTKFYKENGHPGGDEILGFNGTDASVAYHSIHPVHPRKYGGIHYNLRKYCVGTLAISGHGDGNIQKCNDGYVFDSEFSNALVSRVYRHLWEHRKDVDKACNWYLARSIMYILFFSISAVLWILYPSWRVGSVFGLSSALIAMNIAHDASHGALGSYSKSGKIFFDIIGSSSLGWFQQHIMRHHPFTNEYGCDKDIAAAEPFFYFHPEAMFEQFGESGRKRRESGSSDSNIDKIVPFYLRFQHILWIFFFQGYYIAAFIDSVNTKKYPDVVENEYMKTHKYIKTIVASKVVFIIVPYFNSTSVIQYLLALYAYMATTSLVLATLFMVSHNFEGTLRDRESKCWYTQQVLSSCTYGGRVAGYLTGGLNYQIEHHLFPKLPSYTYPIISPLVREICKEFKVKYTYFPTFWANLRSALSYLRVGDNKYKGYYKEEYTTEYHDFCNQFFILFVGRKPQRYLVKKL